MTKNSLNELDDRAWAQDTQSSTRIQGRDTAVQPTDWDADRPLPVNDTRSGGGNVGGDSGSGDTGSAIADTTPETTPAPIGGGARRGSGNGLQWFVDHFKEIAIVAGAAAILAGIIALIKSMSKSIKIRYNKVVKTLQRAQKDFTCNPKGLDMKAVLPGIGSRLNDWITRTITGNWQKKKSTSGNIGLFPFCDRYKDEVNSDYEDAKIAFSKIRATVDASGEIKSSVDITFKSFHEAFVSGKLYEGYEPNMNESVIMSLAIPFIITGLKAGAGMFKVPKVDKKGKFVPGEEIGVQVTKESTREICYAIINNFADKYINMEAVFKKLGIDTKSLSDLDVSTCDKLAKMIEAYAKPEPNTYSKQYSRVKESYDKMLKHYYTIGDGIIDNFKKYTVANDEKHENLLVASTEKLRNMWDTQKDVYDNNFSHVIIEITSSDGYVNYLNFILNYVIPVFKSGLAGDADYVLDLNPKKNEYYVIKQTGNNDALGGTTDIPEGKSALVEIEKYDKEAKKISFKMIGLIEDDYTIDDITGKCDLTGKKINHDAYREDGEYAVQTIDYSKWFSLDPTPATWDIKIFSDDLYKRTIDVDGKKLTLYVFAHNNADDKNADEFSRFVFVSQSDDYSEIVGVTNIVLKSAIKKDAVEKVFTNAGFTKEDPAVNTPKQLFDDMTKCSNTNNVEVPNADALAEYLKIHTPGVEVPVRTSGLYKKEEGDKDIYIFADLIGDLESVSHPENALNINEDDTVEPTDKKNISRCEVCSVKKGTDMTTDLNDKDFNGAMVDIKLCSIKEFDLYVKNAGFAQIAKDENTKKTIENIHKAIKESRGKKGPVLTGDYKIEDVKTIVDDVVSRQDYIDQIKSRSAKIASDIFNSVNSIKKEFKVFPVGKKTSKISRILAATNPSQQTVVAAEFSEPNKQPSADLVFFSGVTFDESDKKIYFHANVLKTTDNKDVLLLSVDAGNYIYPSGLAEADIEKGIIALTDMMRSGKQYDMGNLPNFKYMDKLPAATNQPAAQNPQGQPGQQSGNQGAQGTNNPTTQGQAGNQSNVQTSSVVYKFENPISESNVTEITVNRHIDGKFKNWYILSESTYKDYMNDGDSMLDEQVFVSSLKSKDDCIKFAKRNMNAHFMKFAKDTTYKVVSEKHYVPSSETPLYESVVLVQFNNNDMVSRKMNLGKTKIS